MRFSTAGVSLAIAVTTALSLTACATNEGGDSSDSSSSLSGTIAGIGASSQGSAQEAWIASFQTAHPSVTINYSPDGSGAGRKAFAAGGAAYAGSDSALSDEELAGTFGSCKPDTLPLNLPVYISPIAVIYNVEGVDNLNLNAATLAMIFKGDITMWNDPAIVALNPNATLPSANITRVNRSDDSGTTKNFSDYLFQNVPEIWSEKPSDSFPYPGGEAAKGTSGVADAVANGVNTIGYADASAAAARNLSVAKLQVGDEFVAYSPEAAAAVVDASPLINGRGDNDLAIELDRTSTEPGTYPLVLVSYIIACQEYTNSSHGEIVRDYLEFVVSEEGQKEAAQKAGSAPLSGSLSEKIRSVVASIS
ncbi:phosphate ABC transporter substrate-binding protein PstS [Lysinibacter sp. HNR]|uniref:phosphate ABC transporter substrate-binding protein PstS n=1 Tax=Lysinibacter sp. HNR TaxID=3031408 RepID=UPI002434F063|nr:phosphate ABC transporter substrate-binding protein PstS [Lysinibacter sp. HNR]WGD38112.1 phosphate ABC transporter substrate-binding protein PstS [Lysinibacter sp. HNR]